MLEASIYTCPSCRVHILVPGVRSERFVVSESMMSGPHALCLCPFTPDLYAAGIAGKEFLRND